MGKVFRLTGELNLLLACFGLSALYFFTPDPARCCPVAQACPYMVTVGSILNEDSLARTPLFLSRYIIYLCMTNHLFHSCSYTLL